MDDGETEQIRAESHVTERHVSAAGVDSPPLLLLLFPLRYKRRSQPIRAQQLHNPLLTVCVSEGPLFADKLFHGQTFHSGWILIFKPNRNVFNSCRDLDLFTLKTV